MRRCRNFFAMETIANLSLVLREHRAGCRLPPAQLLSRTNQSPDAVRFRYPSKFTPAHDAVAAAVLHKHHSVIRVGAGLIHFVNGSHSRRECGQGLAAELIQGLAAAKAWPRSSSKAWPRPRLGRGAHPPQDSIFTTFFAAFNIHGHKGHTISGHFPISGCALRGGNKTEQNRSGQSLGFYT